MVLDAHPDAVLYEGPRLTSEDKTIEFLRGAEAAIIAFEPITDRVLSALPALKVLSKFAAGCESIDFKALEKHKIRFGYTFGVNKLSVAELTVAFMVSGLRLVNTQNLLMREGTRPGWIIGRLLTNRTVGIHGCGNIGKEVVRLLKPYHCRVLACDIKDYSDFYRANDVTPVSFEQLLAESEVLTLHLPKTSKTRGLYSREVLGKLRPDALLVNTCRGEIVDEDALAERLEAGKLSAACFDVFAIEPATNDRLLRHPRMLATPHIGAATEETRIAMCAAAIRGLTENSLVDAALYETLI